MQHLEYGEFLPLVDDSLVDGVDRGQVDHLAEDDAVVHLLVHVTAGILDTEQKQIYIIYIISKLST